MVVLEFERDNLNQNETKKIGSKADMKEAHRHEYRRIAELIQRRKSGQNVKSEFKRHGSWSAG